MDNRGKIVIYQTKDGKTSIDVKLENEMVWLTLSQITELFDRDKSVVSRHISNVFREGELDRNSVVAKNATTESGFNSPSSNTFFICLEIVDLFL